MKAGIFLSFADKSKPRGEMFVGVIIVEAKDNNAAVAKCIELKIWPTDVCPSCSLDVAMFPVDADDYDPKFQNRLLNQDEALEVGNRAVLRRPRYVN